jgi:hypothetical protein
MRGNQKRPVDILARLNLSAAIRRERRTQEIGAPAAYRNRYVRRLLGLRKRK